MKVAIRYYSESGNTKKVAEAIGEALGVEAKTVDHPLEDAVDLLFIGGAVYAMTLNKELKAFIGTLSTNKVGKCAVFSTAAIKSNVYKNIKKPLDKQGIPIMDQHFHCKGQFRKVNLGRPNAQDLKEAAIFAKEVMKAFV